MILCCPKVVLYLQTKCSLLNTETEIMLMVRKTIQYHQLMKELDLYRKLF